MAVEVRDTQYWESAASPDSYSVTPVVSWQVGDVLVFTVTRPACYRPGAGGSIENQPYQELGASMDPTGWLSSDSVYDDGGGTYYPQPTVWFWRVVDGTEPADFEFAVDPPNSFSTVHPATHPAQVTLHVVDPSNGTPSEFWPTYTTTASGTGTGTTGGSRTQGIGVSFSSTLDDDYVVGHTYMHFLACHGSVLTRDGAGDTAVSPVFGGFDADLTAYVEGETGSYYRDLVVAGTDHYDWVNDSAAYRLWVPTSWAEYEAYVYTDANPNWYATLTVTGTGCSNTIAHSLSTPARIHGGNMLFTLRFVDVTEGPPASKPLHRRRVDIKALPYTLSTAMVRPQ